jgi:hypothetical protein
MMMPSDRHQHSNSRHGDERSIDGGGGLYLNDNEGGPSSSRRRRLDRHLDPHPPSSHPRRNRRRLSRDDENENENDDGQRSRSKSSSSSSLTPPIPPPPPSSSTAAVAVASTSADRLIADATGGRRARRPTWAPSPTSYPWHNHSSFSHPPPSSLSHNHTADDNRDTAVYGTCDDVSARYRKVDRIGEGTYGVVYRALDRITGDVVALKRCLPHHESSDGFPLTTLREVTILRELDRMGGRDHGIIGLRDVAVSSR